MGVNLGMPGSWHFNVSVIILEYIFFAYYTQNFFNSPKMQTDRQSKQVRKKTQAYTLHTEHLTSPHHDATAILLGIYTVCKHCAVDASRDDQIPFF